LISFRSEDVTSVEDVPEPKMTPLRFLIETLQTIILALVLYFIIDSAIARVRVLNISMEPTLVPGEFLLVNKVVYRTSEIQHGDIIVFHFPQDPKEDYIKRVIGIPGDTVDIHDSQVWVNGVRQNESYVAEPPEYNGTWLVPADFFFVLGDNRNNSSDSHSWGFVPRANVVGKAEMVYWPFNRLKFLKYPNVIAANETS
jgi:signal peptidase I